MFHGVKLNDSLSSSNRGKPNLISEFTVERGMLGQFGRHGVVAAAVLAVSLSSVQGLHVETSSTSPSLRRLGGMPAQAPLLRLKGAGPKKTTPTKPKVATLKDSKQNPVAEWWFSYPCVTRWWFALCCITTLISWDKLPINLPPTGLMLYWPAIIKAQVWRLLTTFTYFGSVGHNMLMEAVFMLNYSKSMEVTYNGARAKYLWHLILNSLSLMVLNTIAGLLGIGMDQEDGTKIPGIPFLAQPLLYSIVWIWARQNPETRMSVFGFFTVPAVYFPWFLLGYHCIMGGGLNIFYLMGFVVGHIFHYTNALLPSTKDSGIFDAPSWLEDLMPIEKGFQGSVGLVVEGGEGDEGKDDKKGPPVFSGKGRTLGKKK